MTNSSQVLAEVVRSLAGDAIHQSERSVIDRFTAAAKAAAESKAELAKLVPGADFYDGDEEELREELFSLVLSPIFVEQELKFLGAKAIWEFGLGVKVYGGNPTSHFFECVAIRHSKGLCSGIQIGHNLILSALHCKIKRDDKVFWGPSTGHASLKATVVNVRPVHSSVDDLVLVDVDQSLPSVPVFQPVDVPAPGHHVHVVGYGSWTSSGSLVGAGAKRVGLVDIVSRDCGAQAGKIHGCIPGRQFVAFGEKPTVSSCDGDSGGPLYAIHSTGPKLVGITLRGSKAGSTSCGIPYVYARLKYYIDQDLLGKP